MTSTIGVYDDQAAALAAISELKQAGFPANQLSLLGHAKGEASDDETKLESLDAEHEFDKPMKIAATGVGIGAVVGPILGALTGLGILAIPGVGFLVGAGALAGAVAGLDAGLIGGGIISALAIARNNKVHEDKYHGHLEAGRYLVVAQGSEEEVKHAHDVLASHDTHTQLDTHA